MFQKLIYVNHIAIDKLTNTITGMSFHYVNLHHINNIIELFLLEYAYHIGISEINLSS